MCKHHLFINQLKESIMDYIHIYNRKYLVFPGEITVFNILSYQIESNNVVLSPIIFTMCIDKLLLELKRSGYGCHINNTLVGAFCREKHPVSRANNGNTKKSDNS